MSQLNTLYIRRQMDLLRAGDREARDELIRAAMGRLERLARKMLKGYPSVARWEGTMDVLQQASLRLVRALETVEVTSQSDFFGLAAAQVRRELLDLARHYQGPLGMGRNHRSGAGGPPAEAPDAPGDEHDLDRWASFHEAVASLPGRGREAFSLSFYQGRTQPEIAELFGVDERTVRRWYLSAVVALRERLGDDLPG